MNSGAPASMAPPHSSSAGRIASHKACSVLYPCASKNLGVYAGVAVFSSSMRWCAYSAACSGITCSTEPAAAPIVSDFRIERREGPSLRIGLDLSLLRLVKQVFRRLPRQRHDAQRRVLVRVGDERRAIRHENIAHIVSLAVLV